MMTSELRSAAAWHALIDTTVTTIIFVGVSLALGYDIARVWWVCPFVWLGYFVNAFYAKRRKLLKQVECVK
jgi:hypothetical protein